MQKHLEYKDNKSNKFWKITVVENCFTVTYGKIGTDGQSKTKTFENECPFLDKDLYLALNWYIIFAFLNNERAHKIKPILEKHKFNSDNPHGFGSKAEAVCSFFAQIGTDGNIEIKGKDAYYFKDKRAKAIQIFKSRTAILNNFEGENLAIV